MKDNAAKYPFGQGAASFVLCGLLGLIWGVTSVPIIAGFAAIVMAPLVFLVSASWWMVNLPIALVFMGSLYCVHRIVARAPANADESQKRHSLTDARYGVAGFGAFYLLAWLGLALLYLNMAPL